MKSKGFTNKLLKEFYKMRDPDGDGSWPDDDDDRDHPDYGEPEYGDRGTGEIGGEDNEEKQKGVDGKACWKGYRREGTKKKGGKTVDNCVKVEDEEVLQEFGVTDGVMAAEKGAKKIVQKLGIGDEEKFDGPGMQWDGIDDEPTSDKELPVGHYEHMVRLTKNYPDDDPWSQGSVQVRKTDKEVIQKFLDKGYRIVKPEDNEEGHPAGGIRSFREKPPRMMAGSAHSFENRKGETQKPYISSYKGVFEVMDKHDNVIFTTRNKREAYKWYKEYMKTFRAEDEEEREPHWPHLPIT